MPLQRRAALALLFLGGCAGQGVTRSGFLANYDDLAATPTRARDLIFVDPAYKPSDYTHVVIGPVAWLPIAGAPERSEAEIDHLRDALRRSLVTELGKSRALVEENGPGVDSGVLLIRAAITNTRRANWWINAPVQAAGIGLAVMGMPGGIPPPNPGGASVEMEAIDVASGRRLVAVVTYANGVPWAPTGYITRFGHARRAFDLAAGLLQAQLARQE
jgi:hypothetical protein